METGIKRRSLFQYNCFNTLFYNNSSNGLYSLYNNRINKNSCHRNSLYEACRKIDLENKYYNKQASELRFYKKFLIGKKRKEKENNMYYTYILRCQDTTLYTGITTDLTRRMHEHFSSRRQMCQIHPKTQTPKARNRMAK